jgi:hypothetical protein
MKKLLLAFLFTACHRPGCSPAPIDAGAADSGPSSNASRARVENRTQAATVVFASFGSGGAVSQADWAAFCVPLDANVGCSFPLGPGGGQDLPTDGKFLNVTLSFNSYPGCNVTLGELDLNNPAWTEDTANISLVNGWSNDVEIIAAGADGGRGARTRPDGSFSGAASAAEPDGVTLGPTQGPSNNSSVFGVYPNGCDVCTAKQNPPCNIQKCGDPDAGNPALCDCKAGSQYNPAVPCQASFDKGGLVTLALVAGVPAMPASNK